MARRKPAQPGVPQDAASRAKSLFDHFNTVDATAGEVVNWDIKSDLLVRTVMSVLGTGGGIGFSMTRDGRAVGITLYSGDDKRRKYCDDSVEFDDYLMVVLEAAEAMLERVNDNGGPRLVRTRGVS